MSGEAEILTEVDAVLGLGDDYPLEDIPGHVAALRARAERAEAERDALALAAAPFTRCPLHGHKDRTSRTRRIDCRDDQCVNPECVKDIQCDYPSHDLAEAVAAIGRDDANDLANSPYQTEGKAT